MTRPKRPSFARKCAAPDCTIDFGIDGPLPFEADTHYVDGALVITCGPECRAKLGLVERKCVARTA